MTGIYEHTEYDADVEEDELLFPIELEETTPPASTVATSDTHLLHKHNDPQASQPAESHALGHLQDDSYGLEPHSPDSLNFVWDHFDKKQLSPTVMAAQAMEALNRTFIELKSKNEEIRLRASYDLRDLVVSASRCKAFYSPTPLILHGLIVCGHSTTFRQISRVLQYCQQ